MGSYSASGRGRRKGLNCLKLGCACSMWTAVRYLGFLLRFHATMRFSSPISRNNAFINKRICRGMLGDPNLSAALLKKFGGRLRSNPTAFANSRNQFGQETSPRGAQACLVLGGIPEELVAWDPQGASLLCETLHMIQGFGEKNRFSKIWSWNGMQLHLAHGRLFWRQDPYSLEGPG